MFIMMVHANSTVSLQKHFLLISNTFKNVYILNVDRSPVKDILLACKTNATAATVCLDLEERLFIQAIKNVFHSSVQNAPVIVFRIFHKPHSAKKKWVVYRLALNISYSASATGKDFLSYQIFFFFNRTATTTHCYPTQLPFSPVPAVSNHLLPPAGPGPVVTRLIPVSKQTGEIPGPEAEAASVGTIENLFISFLWKIAGFPVLGVLPDHTSFPVLILASPSQ